jgi:hypothetical protein
MSFLAFRNHASTGHFALIYTLGLHRCPVFPQVDRTGLLATNAEKLDFRGISPVCLHHFWSWGCGRAALD